MHVYGNISLNSSYNENLLRKKLLDKIKTHILCSITFFSLENHAFNVNMEKIR